MEKVVIKILQLSALTLRWDNYISSICKFPIL